MHLTSNKQLQQFLDKAVKEGWEASHTNGNHIRLLAPNGGIVICSATPSDTIRVVLKIKTDMRREWPEWQSGESWNPDGNKPLISTAPVRQKLVKPDLGKLKKRAVHTRVPHSEKPEHLRKKKNPVVPAPVGLELPPLKEVSAPKASRPPCARMRPMPVSPEPPPVRPTLRWMPLVRNGALALAATLAFYMTVMDEGSSAPSRIISKSGYTPR